MSKHLFSAGIGINKEFWGKIEVDEHDRLRLNGSTKKDLVEAQKHLKFLCDELKVLIETQV